MESSIILNSTANAPPTGPTPGRRCVHCGYDLRGTPAGLCPECGREITSLSESPIPWAHRKAIGRWRGFWRTVRIATRRPRVLIEAATLPVDYRDAQRFRRLLITWIWLWGCAAIATVYATAGLHGYTLPMFEPSQAAQRGLAFALFDAAGYLLPPVPMIGLLITLVLGSTSAGFFARPKELPVWLRSRAVALTRYTLGPLILLPVAIVMAAVVFDLQIYESDWTNSLAWEVVYGCFFFGLIFGLYCVAAYLFHTVRVSAAVLNRGVGRMLATAFGMIAIWIGAIVIGLGLFPMLIGYGWVVLGSLR